MNYYSMNIKETEVNLKTHLKNGLTEKEAQKRLKENGLNEIKEKKKKSNIKKFLSQFNDFMVIILLIAGAISFLTSFLQGEKDFLDAVIIIFIVVLNAILGFFQENKAEKALEALKKMSAPKTTVIRDGVIKKIDSNKIVLGDLIIINNGDYISADARIIESLNLKMEESALTGESLPVEKISKTLDRENKSLGDRKNIVYAGSCAVSGKGKAIVTAVGMETEMGKIAQMLINTEEEQTNLQKKLAETGKILGLGALLICVGIFFIGILRKIPAFEMFMISVSLAVAAIPEGLPAIVTIMLAIGVEKMVKKNAIIRKLPAVESLGSATVICSDKTGTLTQNKMTVAKSVSSDKNMMCKYLSLCNTVEIGEKGKLIGEPTEIGLLEYAMQNNFSKEKSNKELPYIFEIPFDSERKLMSTIHKTETGYKVITKGALDILLNKCNFYYEDGNSKPLTLNKKNEILNENLEMAKDALRVLAVAFKDEKNKPINDESIEKNLVFLGIVGMIDPPRKEVLSAVKECKRAGIKPVMITGDHIETAKAIGKKIGILSKNGNAISGAELDLIPEKELEKNIYSYDIFARVTPEHKVKIVKAFKNNGEIVAMTGDGVNDAPALKTADIGCAMGITGTDVAKGASDIILADDNFSTIVYAVKEGRSIYENIKKSIHFLLSSNIGEIVTILFALLLGFATPLAPIQLLWINLITDSFPAIALGLEPPEKTLMEGRKERVKKGLFSKNIWLRIIFEGMMIGFLGLIAYGIGVAYFKDYKIGSTMAFATLSISQLVHSFNIKSEKSIFKINIFNNFYLILALILGAVLQIGVIEVPFLANIFKVIPLLPIQWVIISFLCVVPIIIVELEKLLGGKKIAIK